MGPDLRARVLRLLEGYRMSIDPIERMAPTEPAVQGLVRELAAVIAELRSCPHPRGWDCAQCDAVWAECDRMGEELDRREAELRGPGKG